jgi:hypothetical protein
MERSADVKELICKLCGLCFLVAHWYSGWIFFNIGRNLLIHGDHVGELYGGDIAYSLVHHQHWHIKEQTVDIQVWIMWAGVYNFVYSMCSYTILCIGLDFFLTWNSPSFHHTK